MPVSAMSVGIIRRNVIKIVINQNNCSASNEQKRKNEKGVGDFRGKGLTKLVSNFTRYQPDQKGRDNSSLNPGVIKKHSILFKTCSRQSVH